MDSIIYKMLLIRRVEEEICARYKKQLMRSPVHLSIGQEAISVGVCHHLRTGDAVFSTHRNHAAYLAKGGSLEKMAFELHGKIGGCIDGRGGSMHLMDKSVNFMSGPIVASAIPLAVGTALANKIDGNGNIVVCFFGDAAVEEGVFHESMNFAALMQLPIIFVCENNQYSVDTPLGKRQPHRDLKKLGEGHGILSGRFEIDYECMDKDPYFKHIIFLCRRDSSPYFIEIPTQRSHVHCGVDKEFELDNDPVKYVYENCGMEISDVDAMIYSIESNIIAAFDAAEAAPLPTPDMASRYVYA